MNNRRTFMMFDAFGNPIIFAEPVFAAAPTQEQIDQLQARRNFAIAELNTVFAEIDRLYFANVQANTAAALLRDSIQQFRQDLINEPTIANDRSALKSAMQLKTSLAVLVDDNKSDIQKRWSIQKFQNTARNSMFNATTRFSINFISNVLGGFLLMAAVPLFIIGIFAPGFMLASVASAIAGTALLMVGQETRRSNRHETRGQAVKQSMLGFFHAQKAARHNHRAHEGQANVNGHADRPVRLA